MLRPREQEIQQKGTETSLIEKFLYPKYGPGQLWEHAADLIRQQGGEILLGWRATRLFVEGDAITAVEAVSDTGERRRFAADYVFSTMPVRELIDAMDTPIPSEVREVSDGLQYRDFITVGLLVDQLTVREADGGPSRTTGSISRSRMCWWGGCRSSTTGARTWSPTPARPGSAWSISATKRDALWKMADEDLKKFAIAEVEKIGILRASDVTDAHVVRVPKTYPAYFGTYDRFHVIREFLDRFQNLYLVGRNGMHKYNNQDHSMLTAMTAVDNIIAGIHDKDNVWSINTEMEYHEEEDKNEARASGSPRQNTESVEAAV